MRTVKKKLRYHGDGFQSNLKESIALSDHVGETLSGSEVLIKILLVRAACGVFPLN